MSREHVVDVLVDLLACSAKHQKMSLLFASYSFKTILYQLLGAGESGRIESLYKLCALKEFLKLLNQNHKGSIFIRAIASGDCPRANSYFSSLCDSGCGCPLARVMRNHETAFLVLIFLQLVVVNIPAVNFLLL